MYWMLWLVLMIAIPLLAGIPLWKELGASIGTTSDEVEAGFQAEDRRDS